MVRSFNVHKIAAAPVVAPFTDEKPEDRVKPPKDNKPGIALFIDVDNAKIGRENLLELLFYVNGKFHIQICRIYGYSESVMPGIKEVAEGYNLSTMGKMQYRPVNNSVVDPRLLIDAFDYAVKNQGAVDSIFVWCYPCDLSHLFEKIIDLGINTATIDNPVFDCNNKFVSEKIRLFSKYEFVFDSYAYRREMAKRQPEIKREIKPEIKTSVPRTELKTVEPPTALPAVPQTVSAAAEQPETLPAKNPLETQPAENVQITSPAAAVIEQPAAEPAPEIAEPPVPKIPVLEGPAQEPNAEAGPQPELFAPEIPDEPIVPQLPRRAVPERPENSAAAAPVAEQPAEPEAPVEFVPPAEQKKPEFSFDDTGEAMNDAPADDDESISAEEKLMLQQMLEQAGFGFGDENKEKTYEDTLDDVPPV